MKLKGNFLYVSVLWLAVGCGSSANKPDEQATVATQKPNIIYILADDLGYGDISYLNEASKINTPHLDKLAQEGIHFTDAHSNSAVCTPTRYGILTGRYAFRTRLKEGVLWGYSPSLIEAGRMTVGTFLQQQGYHTACMGKWHLGLDWAKKNMARPIQDIQWDDTVAPDFDDNVDYQSEIQGGPADHGFDYSFIIPASLDMSPYCYIRNKKVVEAPTAFSKGKDQQTDGRGVFWRPGKMSPSFEFEAVLPTVTQEAIGYIDRQAAGKNEQPFFLYLALPAPHTPWLPTAEVKDASNAGRYGDFVVLVDQMIGKIEAALDKNNIKQNTLIMFTSDNGADWRPDDQAATNHDANYIYKGRKADIYEAGHRIPFIARWPSVIPAGTSSAQTMCTTDLLATLAGLFNQPLPNTAGEDSYNMLHAFKGEKITGQIREATIHHSLQGFFAIRKGKWKLTTQLGSGGFTDPKLIEPKPGEAPGTLYDVESDPEEKVNVYTEHPEVVNELTALLARYQQQGYSLPQQKGSDDL